MTTSSPDSHPPGLDWFVAFALRRIIETTRQDNPERGWCWSTDQETYFHVDDEAQAHGAAIDDLENNVLELGESHSYWIARSLSCELFISPRYLGQHITEYLDEYLGDEIAWNGDDAIVSLNEQDRINLGAIVLAYIRAKGGFNGFGVDHRSIQEHTHTQGEDA